MKNLYNTRVLYVKWSEDIKPVLDINFLVTTNERMTDFSKATISTNYPEDVEQYLKGTKHIPVTQGKWYYKRCKTPLEKAKAIYDWTFLTMYRD